MTTADVFTPEMGKIQLGYHKGYTLLLFQGINMMLVAGCVIVTAIAPVFSEEYAKGTDALILTARYGKTLLVRAKIAAAFIFGVLICMSVVGVNGILFLSSYGTEGWDTSVQVDITGRNWKVPYEMNYGEMLGYAVLIWLAACLLLTGMTLLISACCRTSFAAVVLAAACFVVPVWFSIPQWVQAMMPAYQMQVTTVLDLTSVSAFGQKIMPLWIAIGISATAMIAFGIAAKKKFAGWQVG